MSMDDEQVDKLIQIFSAYSVSYLEMALELHGEGSLDKNKLSERLKRTASRKEEFGFTDITVDVIQQLARGLETGEEVSADETKTQGR